MRESIEKSFNYFPIRGKFIKDSSINKKKSFFKLHNIYG